MIGLVTAELDETKKLHARKVIWKIQNEAERLQNLTRSSIA